MINSDESQVSFRRYAFRAMLCETVLAVVLFVVVACAPVTASPTQAIAQEQSTPTIVASPTLVLQSTLAGTSIQPTLVPTLRPTFTPVSSRTSTPTGPEEMVFIPPDLFVIGNEKGSPDESPPHVVRLGGFFMDINILGICAQILCMGRQAAPNRSRMGSRRSQQYNANLALGRHLGFDKSQHY